MPSFKIETVKWSWPEAVERKEVYRDEQFIPTTSKNKALEAIDFLMNHSKSGSNTYTITVKRDGEYFTYWRHSMPCYGGLVKYKVTHGDKYFMNPKFPRDIRVMFPEGEIVFIGCRVSYTGSPLQKFILSEESPWISGFGERKSIILKEKYLVLTNMDADPTVFYHLIKFSCFNLPYDGLTKFAGWEPKAQLFARLYNVIDPRRFAGQKPIKISGGTWADGYGYTRPYCESIFKTSIPYRLQDFEKAGNGYQYGALAPKLFVSEIKSKFKLDIPEIPVYLANEKKFEECFTEAWDYFKEQGRSLSDISGDK